MKGKEPRPLRYPLGESMADRLAARSGRPLASITVEACAAGQLSAGDIAVAPATLRLQAEVARRTGRRQLADNLERAAEMVAIPDPVIFEVYEQLRPGRARGKAELKAMAARLRREFGAERVARLVEEAAEAYEARNLFRRRFGDIES